MKKSALLLILVFVIFSCKSTKVENRIDIEDMIELDSMQDTESEDLVVSDFFEEHTETDKLTDHDEIEEYDEFSENIEEYIVEAIDEVEEVEEVEQEGDSVESRVEDLEQQVLQLQEQMAQIMEQTQSPAPVTPPSVSALPERVPAPLQVQVPEQLGEIEEEEQQQAETQRVTPPVLPPVRETLPAPRISQSIVVPREIQPEEPSWQSDAETVFSRVVRATVGQLVEIPFRGIGWVYLGELASRRGIQYDSRRSDPDGLSFIFRAEEAGTYALKFSRHDFIRDYILNDNVQVIVGDAPAASAGWFSQGADRERIIAQPRWPSASEEAVLLKSGSQTAASSSQSSAATPPVSTPPREPVNISEVIRGTESLGAAPPNLPVYEPPALPATPMVPAAPPVGVDAEQSPRQEARAEAVPQIPLDELIQMARENFENGNVAGALALLDQYAVHYPSGTDELYWFYGQFYEANTPSRNILLSIDYYKRLTSEFPQSARFNDARRRIAYLERFYINIQ